MGGEFICFCINRLTFCSPVKPDWQRSLCRCLHSDICFV